MKYFIYISIVLLSAISFNCDEGISPEPIYQTGFSGKVSFLGNWPEGITRTHIVVFKDPLLALGDFNIANLKFVSVEIPYGSISFNYNSADTSVVPIGEGEFAYVAVAQQKTVNLSLNRKDWFVVGVYYAGGDTTNPGKLVISDKTLVKGIDIFCDFDNPPPQPPGG